VRVFTWSRLLGHAEQIERAVSSVVSMTETAKYTRTADGIRFDRGCLTLVMKHGGVTTLRDVTPRRPCTTTFQGVYLGTEGDLRLRALDASAEIAALVRAGLANEHPGEGMIAPGSQLRRAYVALRAGAALAGLHHADVHLQHRWGRVPNQAMAYCNGPEPRTLSPETMTLVMEDVEEACSVDAHGMGEGVVRVEIAGACWTEEVDDGPVSILRLMGESGLTAEQLALVR
jgi:hypothetical protein